mgnify:FL=1|tara:strand:+ start:976 stop:1929 length:954 start_codon:yes stop_codon:yes gene_type:complete
MANFKFSNKFEVHDDYYTPFYAWEQITPILKKQGYKTIYEPMLFGSNAQSVNNLETLGFKVIGDTSWDFLKDPVPPKEDWDIIVSNPPYDEIPSFPRREESLKYRIVKKMIELDKPFIIILNSTNIFAKWFRDLFEPVEKHLNFIYPTAKIEFDKYEKGGVNKVPPAQEYAKSINISHAKIMDVKKGRKTKGSIGITDDQYNIWLKLPSGVSFNAIYVCYKAIPHNMWVGSQWTAKDKHVTTHKKYYETEGSLIGYKNPNQYNINRNQRLLWRRTGIEKRGDKTDKGYKGEPAMASGGGGSASEGRPKRKIIIKRNK